jgi:mRNA-degrading endonuclease toxin of MazEF toxin-antitoxin module
MIPKRGEIWWADLGIAAMIRPVAVVSVAYSDGDYALITVAPHTTSPRRAAFEVERPLPESSKGGLLHSRVTRWHGSSMASKLGSVSR